MQHYDGEDPDMFARIQGMFRTHESAFTRARVLNRLCDHGHARMCFLPHSYLSGRACYVQFCVLVASGAAEALRPSPRATDTAALLADVCAAFSLCVEEGAFLHYLYWAQLAVEPAGEGPGATAKWRLVV
jgi:hypothetical protein